MFQLEAQGSYLEVPQTAHESTSTHKQVTKCPENISEARLKCVRFNAKTRGTNYAL